jgi:hypothetical protein
MALLIGCGGSMDDLYPLWVPTDVAVADVDGDGRADVLTLAQLAFSLNQREGRLLVYRQTTTAGVFAPPTTTVVVRYPWRLSVADIDGDGRADVVATDPEARRTWLLRQSAVRPATFEAPQTLFDDVLGQEAAIGDFNGDGVPDVALTDSTAGSRRLLLRYQDALQRGVFGAPAALALPGVARNLAAGDVDGDGRTDLLSWVISAGGGVDPPVGALVVAFQEASGAMTLSAPQATTTGGNAVRLAIAAADGDGRPDLLAYLTPYSTDYRARLLSVPQSSLPGRGFGSPTVTSLVEVRGLDDAALADLDQDGRADAAMVGAFPVGEPTHVESRVNLWRNLGQGAFSASAALASPTAVSRVAAGDINQDGRVDLVLLDNRNQCLVMPQTGLPGSFLAPRALR